MPFERRERHPNPTPQQLIERFDQDTHHVSALDGMRKDPNYLAILELGEAAIPEVLGALKNRTSWMALALNDVVGRDVIGLLSDQSRSRGITAEEVRQNALAWGEAESHIEIRDPNERVDTALRLYKTLHNGLLTNDASRTALAESFFKPRAIVGHQEEGEIELVDNLRVEQSSGWFLTDGARKLALARFMRSRFYKEESVKITLAVDMAVAESVDSLSVAIKTLDGILIPSEVEFVAGNAKPNTRAAVRNFEDMIAQYLPSPTPTPTAG